MSSASALRSRSVARPAPPVRNPWTGDVDRADYVGKALPPTDLLIWRGGCSCTSAGWSGSVSWNGDEKTSELFSKFMYDTAFWGGASRDMKALYGDELLKVRNRFAHLVLTACVQADDRGSGHLRRFLGRIERPLIYRFSDEFLCKLPRPAMRFTGADVLTWIYAGEVPPPAALIWESKR